MAKTNRDEDLFGMMRAAGVRKKVAMEVSDAVGGIRPGGKVPKVASQAVRDFSALAARLEDRVSAGAPKRPTTPQKRTRARKPTAAPRRKEGESPPEAPAG